MIRSVLVKVVIAVFLLSCSLGKPLEIVNSYPEPLPDAIALRFLPGIVSDDSLDFGSAFSPDGRSFYFARSSSSRNGWRILVTHFDGKNWTKPVTASHVEPTYSAADPFITPDGSIYFISNRPRDAADTIPDYDIWVVRKKQDSGWSNPENLNTINTDSSEYYVSIAANGSLYFASNRAGGYGSHDIYVSQWKDGSYSTPLNLGPSVNSEGMEHDPLILPDESFLIFTAVERTGGLGEADLYYSEMKQNRAWSEVKNLGDKINTSTYEYCPALTPDSRYLFFSSDYDVKWIAIKALPFNFKTE